SAANLVTERIRIAERFAGQCLIDDCDLGAPPGIALYEISPPEEGHSYCLEVSWRDHLHLGAGRLARPICRTTFDPIHGGRTASSKWQCPHSGSPPYSR